MPNSNSQRPLLRAATRDGVMLPVIDVTDPRFALPDDPDSIARLIAQSAAEELRNRGLPKFIMRFMLRRMAKRSRIMQVLFGGDGSFLDGITTYVMKLGADNLPPPYDSPMDKRVGASRASDAAAPAHAAGRDPAGRRIGAGACRTRDRCRCISSTSPAARRSTA